jgi:hypothetical protein
MKLQIPLHRALSKIDYALKAILDHPDVHSIGNLCGDVAQGLDELLDNKELLDEKEGIDDFLRHFLFECYTTRHKTGLGFLKFLAPEDVRRRTTILSRRFDEIANIRISSDMALDIFSVCSGTHALCHKILFDKPLTEQQPEPKQLIYQPRKRSSVS